MKCARAISRGLKLLMNIFLVGVLLLSAVFVVHFLYFVMVLRTYKKNEYLDELNSILEDTTQPQKLPSVSILVPTYNEEETIHNKLHNISELNYPQNKIEVIVLDDCSTDKTREIASKAFEELGLRGKILKNRNRLGVNASYNNGVTKANSEYILTTDADVEIHRDALRIAMKTLMHFKKVGGVSAKMIPVSNKNTAATTLEDAYRNFYDSMLTAESAIFSTYPGYTCFALIRKSVFSPISIEYGSSDGNISLSIIKSGFRFICAPNVVFYEPISQKMSEQRRQKIRRAARLIQSTLLNRDMIFNKKYKEFGKLIFPLRFLMLTICPTLIFFAIALTIAFAYSFSLILFALLLAFFGVFLYLGLKTDVSLFNLLTSFLIHQMYLFLGLFLSFRKMSVWRQIERRPSQLEELSSCACAMKRCQEKTELLV
jgi:biofilm PGA synthesis N-glycosyltransferase PgaC